MKKFLYSFRHNIGLKLLSVLIAVVIWYVVVDINDPVETASYPVKVTVENEAYIANGKQIYHIDDANKTINVFLRANRSTLRRVRSDDIKVTADLTQIVDMDRDPVMVPLTAECSGVPQTGITLARTAIPITIETIASKEFPVTVDTGDSYPSQEYEVGTMTANPDSVVINGPESIINQIDSVVARIDVTGMTRSSTKKATLILMDKSSGEMSQDTVHDDLTFEGGLPNVTVNVELWKRQSDVKLKVEYSGSPAAGYHVENISTTPESITVAGNDDALALLRKNKEMLTVPAGMISVEGASDNVVAEIPLADILPEGIRLAKNTAETATVTLNILSDETAVIELDVDHIDVQNLAPDLSMSYGQASVTVRVKGSGSRINKLSSKDLSASIDLSGKGIGEETVPVTLDLPSGVSLEEDVTISVSLKERVRTESDSQTGADSGTGTS